MNKDNKVFLLIEYLHMQNNELVWCSDSHTLLNVNSLDMLWLLSWATKSFIMITIAWFPSQLVSHFNYIMLSYIYFYFVSIH